MKNLAILTVVGLLVIGLIVWCSTEETRMKLPVANYETVEINVYLRQEKGKHTYVGQVTGVSACHELAESFMQEKDLFQVAEEWDLICCTIRHKSHCYEQIK